MSVRGKFTVASVTDHNTGTSGDSAAPGLAERRDPAATAIRDFWKYTPAGTLDITISYPDTAEQFVPGKSFYIDFTEADG